MSVAIYVYKVGHDLNGSTNPAKKVLIYPADFGDKPDDASNLGEDIVNLVNEFDGEDLDFVVEFRLDPDRQRKPPSRPGGIAGIEADPGRTWGDAQ